ncbi:ABC transporter ATP-binding protein [Vallitalea guaymasensis]|uniref:ABC transporter ATP-binding protein n=1 Tax=Vallitalea guaymasensis TaxID=1185412 RepID=UPI002729CDB2|nr:ABC transporter ATP-binding protein [Vallitalea guaymasensis]
MDGFRKIIRYASDYKGKVYKAMTLIFLSVIAGIIPYIMVYDIVIKFVNDKPFTLSYLLIMAGGILLFLLFQTIFYLQGLGASHDAAYDTLMGMRVKFTNKIMTLSIGDIQKEGIGKYKKNLVDDIDSMEAYIAHMIPEGIPYVVMPLIVFIILFIIDWRMGLLSMGSIPFGMIAMTLMMRLSGKMDDYYKASSKANAAIVEYIHGMEVVRIFNKTATSFEKYKNAITTLKDFTLALYRDSWTLMAMNAAILPCTIILLLPVGFSMYIRGTLPLSTFIFSVLLTLSISVPLVRLLEYVGLLTHVSKKIHELEKTMEQRGLTVEDNGKSPVGNEILYKNVVFAYEQKDVIKDVSFKVKENSMTAIVGRSGSGKSTLAKLLVHYWDIGGGDITIGGVSIKNMSFDRLSKYISYVAQDTFLFNIPIMENIRIGKPDATDEEVIKVAKMAGCHDFIMNLDHGYNTSAGDAGKKLSVGEKQRITIARAMIKDAPIIILDEATSSTDAENEDKIQEALNNLIANKTLIIIAHRLSTIVHADQILVMDEGKLVDKGTHNELLNNSMDYKALWDAHMKSMEWNIKIEEGNYA